MNLKMRKLNHDTWYVNIIEKYEPKDPEQYIHKYLQSPPLVNTLKIPFPVA